MGAFNVHTCRVTVLDCELGESGVFFNEACTYNKAYVYIHTHILLVDCWAFTVSVAVPLTSESLVVNMHPTLLLNQPILVAGSEPYICSDSSQSYESAPQCPTSPLTSTYTVSLSFPSPQRRHCHSPDSSRFKISLLGVGAETQSQVTELGEPSWVGRAAGEKRIKGSMEKQHDNSSRIPTLSVGTRFSFLVSGVGASVFLFFLLSFIFKNAPLSQVGPHNSTSDVSCNENLQGDKGRQLKFLRNVGCLLNILLDMVMLMTVPF